MKTLARAFSLFAFTLFLLPAQANEIPEFHKVNDQLYRGGRPDSKGIMSLHEFQIQTIIDIENNERAIEYERPIVEREKMRFISEPMSWSESPTDEQIDRILAQMQDPKLQPIFIHCKHGQDRTGLVVGLYRVLVEGWDAQSAYKEMLENNFHPEFRALDNYFRKRAHLK